MFYTPGAKPRKNNLRVHPVANAAMQKGGAGIGARPPAKQAFAGGPGNFQERPPKPAPGGFQQWQTGVYGAAQKAGQGAGEWLAAHGKAASPYYKQFMQAHPNQAKGLNPGGSPSAPDPTAPGAYPIEDATYWNDESQRMLNLARQLAPMQGELTGLQSGGMGLYHTLLSQAQHGLKQQNNALSDQLAHKGAYFGGQRDVGVGALAQDYQSQQNDLNSQFGPARIAALTRQMEDARQGSSFDSYQQIVDALNRRYQGLMQGYPDLSGVGQ